MPHTIGVYLQDTDIKTTPMSTTFYIACLEGNNTEERVVTSNRKRGGVRLAQTCDGNTTTLAKSNLILIYLYNIMLPF